MERGGCFAISCSHQISVHEVSAQWMSRRMRVGSDRHVSRGCPDFFGSLRFSTFQFVFRILPSVGVGYFCHRFHWSCAGDFGFCLVCRPTNRRDCNRSRSRSPIHLQLTDDVRANRSTPVHSVTPRSIIEGPGRRLSNFLIAYVSRTSVMSITVLGIPLLPTETCRLLLLLLSSSSSSNYHS